MEFLSNLFDAVRGVAPTVAGSIATGASGNPLIGGVVAAVVRGIIGATDDGSPLQEQEARQIMDNPELHLKLRNSLQELEIEKLREETKQIEVVNKTIRAEARSESKAQRGWRPFNGFAFGITLFCDYFLAQIVLALIKSSMEWVHVPSEIYILWSSILGITAGSRGIEKVAKTPGPGILGVLKGAIK